MTFVEILVAKRKSLPPCFSETILSVTSHLPFLFPFCMYNFLIFSHFEYFRDPPSP